ncbi:MAG: heme exporter protein CcmD [Pseudomonadota bacterium]
MMEWLAMGGYAFYVWTSFGLTLLALVGNLVFAKRRHQRILVELRHANSVDEAEPRGGFQEVAT